MLYNIGILIQEAPPIVCINKRRQAMDTKQ